MTNKMSIDFSKTQSYNTVYKRVTGLAGMSFRTHVYFYF